MTVVAVVLFVALVIVTIVCVYLYRSGKKILLAVRRRTQTDEGDTTADNTSNNAQCESDTCNTTAGGFESTPLMVGDSEIGGETAGQFSREPCTSDATTVSGSGEATGGFGWV